MPRSSCLYGSDTISAQPALHELGISVRWSDNVDALVWSASCELVHQRTLQRPVRSADIDLARHVMRLLCLRYRGRQSAPSRAQCYKTHRCISHHHHRNKLAKSSVHPALSIDKLKRSITPVRPASRQAKTSAMRPMFPFDVVVRGDSVRRLLTTLHRTTTLRADSLSRGYRCAGNATIPKQATNGPWSTYACCCHPRNTLFLVI